MIDATGIPRRILLLGGTSEIGLAVVRRLLPPDRSTAVLLAGRDPGRLAQAAATLTSPATSPTGRTSASEGGAVDVRSIDFDAESLEQHAATIEDAWVDGDVDIAILAFGQLGTQDELMDDPAAAARLTTINHTAAVSVGLHVAQRMRAQGHGHIVALSSIAAERARPSNFIYGASKAGLDAFFDGLGYALATDGISVSVIRPGFVHSRMTAGLDVPPLATTPEAVAEAVAAAIGSTGARYVSLPQRALGTALRVLPRAIVRRLP